jgi:hypothetical protein
MLHSERVLYRLPFPPKGIQDQDSQGCNRHPEDDAGPIAAAIDANPARDQAEASRQADNNGHVANLIGPPKKHLIEHGGCLMFLWWEEL